jgi:DNA-binding helix-hairpin-helix protein with protein kinase domain
MSAARLLRTGQGHQITLGKELGRGGEGSVYEVLANNIIAAKLYHPNMAAERQQKIQAMVAAGLHKTATTAAFPIDTLFAHANQFVGFTMPLVNGKRPIHELYSPTSRRTRFPKANFKFLVRTSLNIARGVNDVHSTGCVIGDVNQSGVLIASDAIATLCHESARRRRHQRDSV